jgi:hypothetical protein
VQSYLTGLPLQFLRAMAGFGTEAGRFFLPRANYEPPDSLQRKIFPWLEGWEARTSQFKQGRPMKLGGLDEVDTSLEGFIKLMKYLRVVLLQDMAVLQARKSMRSIVSLYD